MNRLGRLMDAWWRGRYRQQDAPPPDPTVPFRVDGRGETLIEVLESPSGTQRVGITRDQSGIYRLYTERWAEDWDVIGRATWTGGGGHDGSLVDTLERAESLARRSLGVKAPEVNYEDVEQ